MHSIELHVCLSKTIQLEFVPDDLIDDIDGLVQDCSNSIANVLELLQSCTKPSNYVNTGSGFSLASSRWQAITWTSNAKVSWYLYVSLGLKVLTLRFNVVLIVYFASVNIPFLLCTVNRVEK